MQMVNVSPNAKQALQVGRAHKWWWRVAQIEELPSQPIYHNQWWLVPTALETLPDFARQRVEAIRTAGIAIQGIVVAHEAPRMLAAPKREPGAVLPKNLAGTLMKICAAFLTAGLYATGFTLLLGLSLWVDPVVYVVLEDDTWIEMVRWYEDW